MSTGAPIALKPWYARAWSVAQVWGDRARKLPVFVLVILFVGVVLLIITPSFPPTFLLDADWANGVDWAILTGKQFGVDIDFTTGPYANLDQASILSARLYIPAVLATTSTGLVLAFLSWRFARAWLPRWAAALVVTLVVVPGIVYSDGVNLFSGRVLLLTMMCAVGLLTGVLAPKWVTPILVVLTVFSALALVTKFSNGTLSIATVVLIAAFCTDGRIARRAITALGVIVLTALCLIVFWLLAGQQLGNLGSWFGASFQLTAGYPEAMSTDDTALVGQYVALVLLGVVVLLQVLVRRGTSRWLLLILGAWAFVVALRLGFTRHDIGHSAGAFALISVLVLALGVSRQLWLALAAVVVSVATLFSSITTYASIFNPITVASRSRGEVLSLVSSGYRDALLAQARTTGQDYYKLSPGVIAALQGQSVHVDPIEVNAAWAYSLDWNPVPAFQSYSAYTSALDAINARALVAKSGPSAVLRGTLTAIDARNPMWESPQYMTALVCDFVPKVTSKKWLVLDRAQNRCGGSSVVSTVKFGAGETITVPSAPGAGYMIVASMSTTNSPLNALATEVFKPFKKVVVKTNQGDFRLPRAHEVGPLILKLPKSVGWAAPFGGKTNITTFTVSEPGTVVFSVMKVAASG